MILGETVEPLSHVLLGASLTGLGAAVVLLYRNAMTRITEVDSKATKEIQQVKKRQDAHTALFVRMAMKVGVEEQFIKEVQDAIRSGS